MESNPFGCIENPRFGGGSFVVGLILHAWRIGTVFVIEKGDLETEARGRLNSSSELSSYFLTLLLAEGIALFVVELLVGDALGLDEVEELAEGAAFLSAALVFVGVA